MMMRMGSLCSTYLTWYTVGREVEWWGGFIFFGSGLCFMVLVFWVWVWIGLGSGCAERSALLVLVPTRCWLRVLVCVDGGWEMVWNMVEAGLVWDLLGGGGLGPRLNVETVVRNGSARTRRDFGG